MDETGEGKRGMSFIDRRLATNKLALEEMESMERHAARLAQTYGLAGKNIPKVIGASDEKAWVGTKYLLAWGCEIDAWETCEPRNYTIHYPSRANPQDLGGLLERELLEGRKFTPYDVREIALLIGRHRELTQAGFADAANPLWSYAAAPFTKAVILEELQKKGRLDLRSPQIKMHGPVAGLSFKAQWTEHLDEIESGKFSVSGTINVPRAARSLISSFAGQPLSRLISGKSYESLAIKSIHLEPDFLDEDSEEVSLTIFLEGSIERLGNAPDGVTQDNPVQHWLDLAKD